METDVKTIRIKPLCTYAVAIALGSLAIPVSTSFSAAPFDGKWSVQITSEVGKCSARYTVPIRVSGGRVSYSGPFDARAKGNIGANGALRVSFAHRADVVNARGSVKGNAGLGSWKSPTKNCSGTWVARKA